MPRPSLPVPAVAATTGDTVQPLVGAPPPPAGGFDGGAASP